MQPSCGLGAGWEKGQVEKQVRDVRHALWQDAPTFASLDALNQWLLQRCRGLWQTNAHPTIPSTTIAQQWKAERTHLMPMPAAFDGYIEHSKHVSSTCLITFERNRYSVPAQWANGVISLRVYADRLVMVADGDKIAEHPRIFLVQDNRTLAQTCYD